MFLTGNQSLNIYLSPTPTSAISVSVDYADHTARIPVAGNTSLLVSSASSVIVTAATSPNQRQIKNISIFNPNAQEIEVTIKQNYPPELIRKIVDLQFNQTLEYTDHIGWTLHGTVLDNDAEAPLLDTLDDYFVAVSGDTMSGALYTPSLSSLSSVTYYNNIQPTDGDVLDANNGITLSVKKYTTKLQKILATSFSGDAPYNFQTSFLSKNIFMLLPQVASNTTQINYNRVTSGTISNTGGNLGLGLQGIMRFFRTTTTTNPGGGYLAHGSNTFLRGNSSSIGGGWMFSAKFTNFTNYSGQGSFVGMRRAPNITTISATLPSQDVCLFGLMSEVSGNMKIIHSDISGPASTIDLGSQFPYDSSTVYHFISYCEPDGSSIEYYVKNLNSGSETFGEVSENIFDKETFVSNVIYVRTTASNVSAARVGTAHLYLETNY